MNRMETLFLFLTFGCPLNCARAISFQRLTHERSTATRSLAQFCKRNTERPALSPIAFVLSCATSVTLRLAEPLPRL